MLFAKLLVYQVRGIGLAALLAATLCAQEHPKPDVEPFSVAVQPVAISVVQRGASATLSFIAQKGEDEVVYQWYRSDDGTLEAGTLIEGAEESSYTTEIFVDREIRYYYCVASSGEERVVSDVAAVAYTGLPVLYVNTPKGVEVTSKEEWIENATLTLTGADENSWNFENISTSIRGRGNTTWKFPPKKPYALKLERKRGIMGMPKHKRWVLIANYYDNSFMKNHMAFYLSEKFHMDYTVHGKFVDLFFNGDYRGLYWLGEAIKVDKNRVDIDDGNEGLSDKEDKDYLIEMDNGYDEPAKFKSPIRELPYMVKNDDYMVDENGELTSGGSARLARLSAKIEKLESLLYPDYADGMNSDDCSAPDEAYARTVDVESWAKFWLVNEIMDNGELIWPKSAYFVYDSKNDVLKAGPVWDFDWGILSMRKNIRLRNIIYYNALFKSPIYIAAIKMLWGEYSSDIAIGDEIEKMRDYLKVPAEADLIKWGPHLDPSKVERDGFDEYVDFLKAEMAIKMKVVDEFVTDSLPQNAIASPSQIEYLSSGSSESDASVEGSGGVMESFCVEPSLRGMNISAEGRSIRVNAAMIGSRFAVIDAQGIVVKVGRVGVPSFEIPVSGAGVYMVRIGSEVRKIHINR